MESLGRALVKDTNEGLIKGIKNSKIPYNNKEAKAFKKILKVFEAAKGPEINPEKSPVLFIKHKAEIYQKAVEIIGFKRGDFLSKHLGYPLTASNCGRNSWHRVIDKIKHDRILDKQISIYG